MQRSHLSWIVILTLICVVQFIALLHLQYSVETLRGDLRSNAVDVSTRIDEDRGMFYNGTAPPPREDLQNDFSAMIAGALPSVVSIRTNLGIGSGTIISAQGHVVTNYHVVEGIRAGVLRTYDGGSYEFTILATDEEKDLALLEVRDADRTFAPLAFTDDVTVGERVIALGSPAGLDFTATEGIVSAVREGYSTGFVQTDVPINPGNSGGPLLDPQGRIVGITTFKSRGYEGLGFAIRAVAVQAFIAEALDQDS